MKKPPRLGIAIPNYMEEKALNADMPPGHRFNLYAPMWVKSPFIPKEKVWALGEEISEKKDKRDRSSGHIIEEGVERRAGGKTYILEMISNSIYSNNIRSMSSAMFERQKAFAQNLETIIIPIKLTSPFAVGLGNDHPVENGFSFLSPYGLPYIAGSGIKGVLRKEAQESGISPEEIEILFGKEDQNDATRGALTFWDGFPQCDRMTVEVMTPHQSDYYQGNDSPHDQGTPTPIQFLAVPANTAMNIIVQCDKTRLKQQDYDWQGNIIKVIEYASRWLGFGAKTSVGYGSFEINSKALEQSKDELKAKEEKKRLESLSPEEQEKLKLESNLNDLIKEFVNIKNSEKNYNPSSSKLNPKLKGIYEVCSNLKNEKSKQFLEDIFAFVKSNDKKKKEVRKVINEIFGTN